jgi:hypothetical protein
MFAVHSAATPTAAAAAPDGALAGVQTPVELVKLRTSNSPAW